MPVILDRSAQSEWLNLEIHEQEDLRRLLKPCPDDWLTAAAVSPLVNSPKNNTPEVLEPATASMEPQGRLFEDF
jgi:putative SOS response-associated peptidase YedK